MNSFSHATNYPPIMLSGLVDLINADLVPLPQGALRQSQPACAQADEQAP